MNTYMSLKDHVYNFISQQINEGSLTPDDKISEQQICNVLNVSRTPVREALIQLSTEGYIENLPRKGFVVKHIDENKARDLYIVIGCLEGLAASLACSGLTTTELSQMRTLVDAIDSALMNNAFDMYYELQLEFHNIYIDCCGNQELVKTLQNLKRNFIKKSYTANNEGIQGMLSSINTEHRQIVDLLEKKDSTAVQNYVQHVHWNPSNAQFNSF